MMSVLVIAAFVAIHLHAAGGASATPIVGLAWLLMGTLAGLWSVVWAASAAAGRALDTTGNYRAVIVLDRVASAARFAAAALVVASVLWLGWVELVRSWMGDLVLLDELAAILPLMAFMTLTWWSSYPVERRVREAAVLRHLHEGMPLHAPPSRAGFVVMAFRHQVLVALLPLSLITAWDEAVPRVAGLLGWSAESWWQGIERVVSWGGIIACLVVAPALMRVAWDTVAIGPGHVRDLSRRVCAAHGVRVRGPYLWRTRGSSLNGAVIGLVWPFRYLLFTDALLEHLSDRQVEGVVAHEVAHLREHHPVWLGLSMLALVALLGWVQWGLAASGVLPAWAGGQSMMGSVLSLLGALWGFGWVSRRFERQADAFAVRHLTRAEEPGASRVSAGAVEAMAGALGVVADMNGMPVERWDFRHGSIADRQRRLVALEAAPLGRFPIDRVVRRLKVGTVVVLAASIVPIVFEVFMSGG